MAQPIPNDLPGRPPALDLPPSVPGENSPPGPMAPNHPAERARIPDQPPEHEGAVPDMPVAR